MDKKEINDLIRVLRTQGFSVEHRRSNHYKVTSPGGSIVFMSCTPGGGNRSLRNLRSDLRRIGADV